ncbi:MAG: GNAT family N-acetyltransferase, partial [Bacteroidota bacterium]
MNYKIFSSVDELPDEWDSLSTEDTFLKSPFLRALERSSPLNIKTYFVGCFLERELVGIALLQHVQLFSSDVFRRKSDSAIKELGKRFVSFFLKGNALVIGNLMHTGQHAFWFDKKRIDQAKFLEMILVAARKHAVDIKQQSNNKIKIIALKDFFEDDPIHRQQKFLKSTGFFKAKVQPNMVFDIRDTWLSTEAYVSSFNKKYRRRYRTALKKKSP